MPNTYRWMVPCPADAAKLRLIHKIWSSLGPTRQHTPAYSSFTMSLGVSSVKPAWATTKPMPTGESAVFSSFWCMVKIGCTDLHCMKAAQTGMPASGGHHHNSVGWPYFANTGKTLPSCTNLPPHAHGPRQVLTQPGHIRPLYEHQALLINVVWHMRLAILVPCIHGPARDGEQEGVRLDLLGRLVED